MSPGFFPPPAATPSGSATELDGVPMNFAPPAAPPAPATQVDGTPVDWEAPLAVPSGSSTQIADASDSPEWELEVTDVGAEFDVWDLLVDGVTVAMVEVGNDEWALQVLTPGTAGDEWTVDVAAGLVASYTVLGGDTADDVAAGLDAALEALTGVTSSSLTDTVTFALDSGAPFAPVWDTDGAGTATLTASGNLSTPTEVATDLEADFDAPGFSVARSGAVLTVTKDAPGYLTARLETNGVGTSTRTYTAIPKGYDPQPVPDATPGTEIDGVPVTWEPPAATPSGGGWTLTQS